jgi:hypothetical protein
LFLDSTSGKHYRRNRRAEEAAENGFLAMSDMTSDQKQPVARKVTRFLQIQLRELEPVSTKNSKGIYFESNGSLFRVSESECLFSLWRPDDSQFEMFAEGKTLLLNNAFANAKRGASTASPIASPAIQQLSSCRSFSVSEFPLKLVSPRSQLQQLQRKPCSQPDFEMLKKGQLFDLVGVILAIGDLSSHQTPRGNGSVRNLFLLVDTCHLVMIRMYDDEEQKHFTKDMEPMKVLRIQDVLYDSFDQRYGLHTAHSGEVSTFDLVAPLSKSRASVSSFSPPLSSAIRAAQQTLLQYMEHPVAPLHMRLQILKANHILSGSLVPLESAKVSTSEVI